MLADTASTMVRLLVCSLVAAALTLTPSIRARHGNLQNKIERTAEPQAADEPVMRIALSTDTRAATISTTAQLVKVSEFDATPQPLETARVRVESRLLAPTQPATENIEIVVARALSRDDADRLIDSVHELADEEASALAEPPEKWRVVVVKHSIEDAEAALAKLESAGFDATTAFKAPTNETTLPIGNATTPTATDVKQSSQKAAPGSGNTGANRPTATSPSRVKLTSRATAPNREIVAFAAGAAPLHSSAPVVFASTDEKNAPVRFNDKAYRGRIEVFANRRGSLTVVNVIGLEDYVRGVVPNELSFPALEALKAQAIAARTYALKNRGQFAPEGFDLLPTTRSQVYRGLTSETSLTTRAVDETRGVVATYNGEPINALYTSTCGGRTEDAENIFNQAVPYLRSRECAAEMKAPFAPFTIKSSRDLIEIKDEKDLAYAGDGAVSLFADATVRPKETLTRGRALHAIARMLESRGSLQLQKGTTRPAANGIMMLRSGKSKEQPVVVSRDAFLFRQFGENLYQMKSVVLVGGEPVTFHVSPKGEVDYLEVKPATDGASAERFSPFTNWTSELSVGQVQARLARSVRGIGALTDLKVAARGSSRRVIDLEVIGTQAVGHIRGGRIRSALGLREQLFVIDRVYGANDRVAGFVFPGRGWRDRG